jgi:hypothetical protein
MEDQNPTPIIWTLPLPLVRRSDFAWLGWGRNRNVGRLQQPAALQVVASGRPSGDAGGEDGGGAGAGGAPFAPAAREDRAGELAGPRELTWRFAVPAGAAAWDRPEPQEWFVARYTLGETEFTLEPCRDNVPAG